MEAVLVGRARLPVKTEALAPSVSTSTARIFFFNPKSGFCFSSGFPLSLSSCRKEEGRRRRERGGALFANLGDEERESSNEIEDVERALGMDGGIPKTSEEFLRRVSSRAYGMRRDLQQTLDSISYDVLDSNPWRGNPKPVYVLTQRENQLWTMKTRINRSEVEREFGLLFSRGKRQSDAANKSKNSRSGFKFRMLVEDIREGLLVFEDKQDAAKYCDLLQGGGQGCEGIAELEASSVFDICRKMKALAVLFRRGRTPPLPENLQLNLRARKRSLEDHEEI